MVDDKEIPQAGPFAQQMLIWLQYQFSPLDASKAHTLGLQVIFCSVGFAKFSECRVFRKQTYCQFHDEFSFPAALVASGSLTISNNDSAVGSSDELADAV